LAAFLAALALAGCTAQLADGRACLPACEAGKACVVGRCRAAEESPAPADTRRVFVVPVDVAVIAERGSQGAGLPETIALGRAADGTVELLLRFTPTWRDDADVVSAFVVLDPVEGALPSRSPASVETARILEPWQPATVTWGRQPRLDLPRPAGIVSARPSTSARIDVTPLVRDWSKRLPDDYGIALLVQGSDALGGAFTMGTTAGNSPCLEAYVR
jgi:hypothetical protein